MSTWLGCRPRPAGLGLQACSKKGVSSVVQEARKEREWHCSLAFNLWSKSHLLVVDRTNEDVFPGDNTPPVRAFMIEQYLLAEF